MRAQAADISPQPAWWRDAVVYQVYPRSFADGNGDGIGDIAGLRARLPYLAGLGVDALWISPWYPSPMADHGYDVSDHRDIDPLFGTLGEAEAMIGEAHAAGLRVLLDIVPNHTSDRHPWFREALASPPGSPQRRRYHFRPGRGVAGELPPNDWRSKFGTSHWTRVTGPDGTPGEWYLHLFAPQQPDLNWDDAGVRAEFESILRFWFDRGVDGFRIDSAHGLVKQDGLPDIAGRAAAHPETPDHPYWHREQVHDVYRAWRRIADSYPEPRVLVAEVWVDRLSWLTDYVRPDELHVAFSFEFLSAPWRPDHLRRVIDESIAELGRVGAPPAWTLSNHDVVRPVSRFGRPQPDHPVGFATDLPDAPPPDLELGDRRARAAALLMLALPGGVFLYQGEELGLWEVEDIPEHLLQDPSRVRAGDAMVGRDGCRVPLPWSGERPPFGFGPAGATAPWLPQPEAWRTRTVRAEERDPGSVLQLYRSALRLRRDHPALGDGTLAWDEATYPRAQLLSFTREPGFRCVVNLSDRPVPLPAGDRVLLSSSPLAGGPLPPDTTVWLRPSG